MDYSMSAGENVINTNRACNMKHLNFYVCPVCGNIIQTTGEAVISCCGITLPPLEAENEDSAHQVKIEVVEDEYFVSVDHEMTKTHYISFIAAVRSDGVEIKKIYPEQNAEARFKISGTNGIFVYCNQHGLYKVDSGKRQRGLELFCSSRCWSCYGTKGSTLQAQDGRF